MIELAQAWNDLNKLKGKVDHIRSGIQEKKKRLRKLTDDLKVLEQANEIIKEVGLKTQEQLEYHISDITSLALESVFEDEAYKLIAKFTQRRNKTECDLLFEKDGEEVDPLNASGGGAVDVAAFALRIALWSMMNPKTRATIVLDEPLRFLSVDLQDKASQMIKELSEKLGIQFIIITHEDTLTQYADRVFTVIKQRNKSSKVIQS